jgi:long-chain acyl-CoA synthetase
MQQRTIPEMFEESVRKYPNNILMWEKKNNKYEGITYREMQKLVYVFAAGLIKLGVHKGDRLALISEGRNYWVMSELGILYAGGVNVPISVKIDELNDLKFRLSHSECKIVIVSRSQIDKIRKIKKELPDLQKIIVLDNISNLEEDEIFIDYLFNCGDELLKMNPDELTKILNSVSEYDYANICYTSGTTADPKGIILTHRNYTANVEQASSLLPIPEWYTSLLILPWDHCFAHTAGIYTLMKNGASMASVQSGKTPLETLKNIPNNIKEIKPVFLLSVPALAKNFRKNIEKGVKEKGSVVEHLFYNGLKVLYAFNGNGWNRGKGLRKILKPLVKLYDKIIFSKIRESFGGRLEFFIGGGALLDIELQKFFYAIGIPMFQGYGLSESSPVISSNVPLKHKLGSSGFIVKDLEIRICDENGIEVPVGQKGEIVVKGENVMAGYWKNEKATKETIRQEWLFTGDLGYMDTEGFLYVLGRNKSLLIASDGEKYSPEGIEETITERSKYIEQIMLYNNQNPYTVALVVPNKDSLKHFIKEHQVKTETQEGIEKILKIFEDEISNYRNNGKYSGMFPERWLPSAIALLDEPFTEQNQFLNSTLKIVRGKITEHYRSVLDFLYTPEAKNIGNKYNIDIVKKLRIE